MIDPRIAYGLGVFVGGAAATIGWSWIARHPAFLVEWHARQVRAYGSGRGAVTPFPHTTGGTP